MPFSPLRSHAIRLTLQQIDAIARATALSLPRRSLAQLVFRCVVAWPKLPAGIV
jgi:hypothetical protein